MNCLTFRQLVASSPQELSEDARAHALSCTPCKHKQKEWQAMDASLKKAMKVRPSEDLMSRVVFKVATKQRRQHKVWALAASALLAIGLGAGVWLARPGPNAIHHMLVDHILHEPASLQPALNLVSDKDVNQVLQYVSANFAKPLGSVHYAGVCEMHGMTAAHLVVDTAHGLVTVLVTPESLTRKSQHFEERGFVGHIMPTDYGSIAIVGGAHQDLRGLEQRVRQQLEWTI